MRMPFDSEEAKRLNIPIFAMVDTNSNPTTVDFPIPANDDATKSISIILDTICGAVKEGLEERSAAKNEAKKAPKAPKAEAPASTEATPAVEAAPVAEAPAVEAPATEATTEGGTEESK